MNNENIKIDEAIYNKSAKLANLSEYQDGAVVSRTLINKPTGTVTVFSFAEGQGLSEHTAPFDAMVYVIDGTVEITIAGTPHKLTAGETIIMPANLPHALKALEQFKMLLVMIK